MCVRRCHISSTRPHVAHRPCIKLLYRGYIHSFYRIGRPDVVISSCWTPYPRRARTSRIQDRGWARACVRAGLGVLARCSGTWAAIVREERGDARKCKRFLLVGRLARSGPGFQTGTCYTTLYFGISSALGTLPGTVLRCALTPANTLRE